MTPVDFITELFCRIDDNMVNAKKHVQANLSPSEVVTLAILFALKGVGNRAFYRWLERDSSLCFPNYLNAPGSFGCSIPTATGSNFSWQSIV